MRTFSTTVYKFSELSEAAQKNAIEAIRSERIEDADNFWSEPVIEDFKNMAKHCGWTVKNVYWTGFSSQGDGACFEGTWDLKDVNIVALREEAPRESRSNQLINEIGDLFTSLAVMLSTAQASVAIGSVAQRGRYYHDMSTEFDTTLDILEHDDCMNTNTFEDLHTQFETELKDVSRSLMRWFYRQLESAYDYYMSDADIKESLTEGPDDDREFYVTGRPFRTRD